MEVSRCFPSAQQHVQASAFLGVGLGKVTKDAALASEISCDVRTVKGKGQSIPPYQLKLEPFWCFNLVIRYGDTILHVLY
ncbi:unnamed protein product [Urochloa humidicola]